MSTNDDSASRRGRRADQSEPDWRAHNRRPGDRWDQPSSGNRENAGPHNGRDNAAYSGYTRPSYSHPRAEQSPPQTRPYDGPPSQQNYYQDPVQRPEFPRPYSEPSLPAYSPPQPSYPVEPQLPSYSDPARDDLFARDSGPLAYDQNPYGSQPAYKPSGYDPASPRAPLAQPAAPADYYRQSPPPAEDYERGFGARITPPENTSPRFFLPDEQPQTPQQQWSQQSYAPSAPQAPAGGGYGAGQAYQAGGYEPQPQSFGQGQFDPRYAGQEAWAAEDQGYQENSARLPALHGEEFDEDFFGDEEDFEDDQRGSGRGRKKLIAAAVAAALVAGGGGYAYKTMMGGGDKATPIIRADNKPSKETPGNPGGRQFPNGEKAIYERLTPDGQTQVAPAAPPPAAMPPVFAQANAAAGNGNSLDDRIEEALKRAQHSGDAPPAPAGARTAPDQPTVVRSEIYRPDGTRVDSRPMIQPQFGNVNQGSLPPPFGNGPAVMQPAAAPPPVSPAPFRTAAAAPQPQLASAMAAPPRGAPKPAAEPVAIAPAGSFYVSLKSAPDEKAIQRDLPTLTDKYKSVLGDVQIQSKIADLGAKGVTYRAVAGPLGSRQEAMELCQKIKGVGGDKACFVTN